MSVKLFHIKRNNNLIIAHVHIDYDKVPDFVIEITQDDYIVRNTRILDDEFVVAARVKLDLLNQNCIKENVDLPTEYTVDCDFRLDLERCNCSACILKVLNELGVI